MLNQRILFQKEPNLLKKLILLIIILVNYNIKNINPTLLSAITNLVYNNPGQLCVDEYSIIAETILKKRPCNLLIFGVGKDGSLWIDLNKDGYTVFIEDNETWLQFAKNRNPTLIGYLVNYNTKLKQWKELLQIPGLLTLDLPYDINSKKWDIIFVDGPAGNHDTKPGRMKSIYTASLLAQKNNNVDVFVHDCDRIVEATYSDTFLFPKNLLHEVYKLRHYVINRQQQIN